MNKTQQYSLEGMTCQGCVKSVKNKLSQLAGVEEVKVQLTYPQVEINAQRTVRPQELEENLPSKYKVGESQINSIEEIASVEFKTYIPLITAFIFLAGIATLAQYPFDSFSVQLWMRYFMAGFLISFSFLKLINLSGFANSYSMYDIIAKKWLAWGYIYPFIELGLGVMFFIGLLSIPLFIITFIILLIGTIGVMQSVLAKKEIRCACMGAVFNLPLSKVTIAENSVMMLMLIFMILK